MKFLLAMAPWDMWEGEDDTLYPLGLAYLGAVLEKNNHEVDILNLTYSNWEDVKPNAIEKIKSFNPDILGISILSNSRISTKRLIEEAKKINPNLIVIAGGVHTTFLYNQILENYPVDYAVLGEAEKTIIELSDAIKNKKPLEDFKKIKGIAFKEKNQIIKTEPRERIRNLDELPFPKHEFFEKTILKYDTAYMMTSRGCPFGCSFCPSSAYWGRCMIQRSAENILEEIKYLLKKYPNIKKIYFLDDEFLVNNNRIIQLCKMLIENNIKIKWSCLGRASSINDELISWIKRAGCFEVIFGVESGSQRILDNIGKKVKVEQIENAIKICKKYGLSTSFLSIIGLPGETYKSAMETAKLAKKVKEVAEPAILIVFPGTRVYELAKEKGMMADDYWMSEGLCPLYTAEHSKAKLWLWSFKVGLTTHLYADNGNPLEYLNRKIFSKLKPRNFIRIFKRYVTDRT